MDADNWAAMAARSSEQATKSAGEAEEILGDGVSLHKASMLLPSAPKLQSTFDRCVDIPCVSPPFVFVVCK